MEESVLTTSGSPANWPLNNVTSHAEWNSSIWREKSVLLKERTTCMHTIVSVRVNDATSLSFWQTAITSSSHRSLPTTAVYAVALWRRLNTTWKHPRLVKMTIIWALQSETSAQNANRRVCTPQAWVIGGLTWESGGASWASLVGSRAQPRQGRQPAIFSYIRNI